MAVQTVDFANINTVIKDGVTLSEIVLDGSVVWTAPPATNEGISAQIGGVYSTPSPISSKISALSSDGLVLVLFLQEGEDDGSLYIYSRPSITSPNFTLLDTLANVTSVTVKKVEVSHDGSVILWESIDVPDGGGNKVVKMAADDGNGSYTINNSNNFTRAVKAASLGADGETVAYITNSELHVLFNIGTKATPNWVSTFTKAINTTTKSVAVSRRDPTNGVTVITGFEDAFPARDRDGRSIGYRGSIHTHIMDSSFNWTQASVYHPSVNQFATSVSGAVGGSVAISDDGKTIISALNSTLAWSQSNSRTSYSILTLNVAQNRLAVVYTTTSTLPELGSSYREVSISGDGNTASVSTSSETVFRYSKSSLYDASFEVGDSTIYTANSISYDGTIVGLGDTVYERIPQFTLSTPASLPFINEGQPFTIRIDSVNVPSGTVVDYTITGIQAADILESKTGSFTISNNVGYQVFNAVSDLTTEGNQTATLTLDDYPDTSFDFTILDSSQTP